MRALKAFFFKYEWKAHPNPSQINFKKIRVNICILTAHLHNSPLHTQENLNSYLNLTHHPVTQLPVTSSSVDPSHVVRKSFQKRNHLIADRLNRYEKRLRETFSELEMCTCAPPPRPLRPMASVPLSSKIVESREFAIGDQSGSSKNRTRMFRSECGKGNGRIDQSEKRQNSFGDSHRSDIGKIKGSDNSTGQSESAKLVQSENSNSSADFSKKRSAGDVKQGGSLDRARQAPPIPLPPLSTHHHSGFHWFMDKEISRMKTRKKELAHMFKKFGSLDHLHPSAVTQINPTNLNTSIVTGKAKFRIDMAKNGATGDVTNILSSDYNGHLAPLPEPDTYQNDPTHPNYSSSIHTSSQLSTASSTPSSLSGKENNNSSTFYIGSGYLAQPPTHKTSSSVRSVKSSNSQDRRFNPPATSPDKTALAPEKYGSKQTLGSHHALITPFNPNPIVAHDQDHNAPNILAGNGASNNLTNNRDMVENEANLEDGKYSGEILDHSPSKQQKELDYYGNQIPTQQGQNYQMQYQGQLEKLAQQQNQDRRNLDSLRIKNQQDFASFNESMSEIGFRCENLNEQITDIVELQQSETENLRLEIKALEEKMSYQIDDRTQDILEMMENIQTRISKLELAQQRQQIGSLEGLEMSAARNLLLKFINILLAFLQLVLLLTSTFATILSPFVKTRSRTFVTLIVSLCVALLLKTNPNFQRQCINLIHRLFLMPSHKS
ncbi:unnamed protein product [Gordionus sp. m RMFG-2023]